MAKYVSGRSSRSLFQQLEPANHLRFIYHLVQEIVHQASGQANQMCRWLLNVRLFYLMICDSRLAKKVVPTSHFKGEDSLEQANMQVFLGGRTYWSRRSRRDVLNIQICSGHPSTSHRIVSLGAKSVFSNRNAHCWSLVWEEDIPFDGLISSNGWLGGSTAI